MESCSPSTVRLEGIWVGGVVWLVHESGVLAVNNMQSSNLHDLLASLRHHTLPLRLLAPVYEWLQFVGVRSAGTTWAAHAQACTSAAACARPLVGCS